MSYLVYRSILHRAIPPIFWLLALFPLVSVGETTAPQSVHEFSVRTIDGEELPLRMFRGKVLLIVNTALKCGTTPQYGDLQKLYDTYRMRGLVVLGFPSNDFTGVEPKDPSVVKSTCKSTFGVTFPLFSETHVSDTRQSPLFDYLTKSAPEEMRGPVSFNFEKFLVDRTGRVRARYGAFTNSLSTTLLEELEKVLNEKGSQNGE